MLNTGKRLKLSGDLQHGVFRLPEFQFVRFRGQNHQRQLVMFAPFHHHLIEFSEWVTNIHHQNQAAQALAVVQVLSEMLLPVILHVPGYFGVAIPRQIHKPGMLTVQGKKLIRRVRPGVLLVRASLPIAVIAFMALDFPAFERPAKATSAPMSVGQSSSRGALTRKRALLKEMLFESGQSPQRLAFLWISVIRD